MSLTDTDLKLLAAVLGVVGTVIGLVLGAGIQAVTAATGRRRERLSLYAYSAELIINVRSIVTQYESPENSLRTASLGIVFPDILLDELTKMRDSARSLSPTIAVEGMWLAQACTNLKESVDALRSELVERRQSNKQPLNEKKDVVLTTVAAASGVNRYTGLVLAKLFFRCSVFDSIRIFRHVGPVKLYQFYRARHVK